MNEDDIPLSERLFRESREERDPLMRSLFRVSASIQLADELTRHNE